MLGIKTKLSTLFHSQTDGQIERMNQELEQYLKFFVDHRQKNWPEWLALVEFAINNKTHLTTKVSLFMENYEREPKNGSQFEKERKNRESNEVYEKNRKDIERSRSSINESIGRNEETSRQRKEESGSMESRR